MRKGQSQKYGSKLGAVQVQGEKFMRHFRAGSNGTKSKYKTSCRQFLKFVNDKFKVQNIRNIQNKHIAAFITHRQDLGRAPSTINNDITAIRYMHDMIPNAKYEIYPTKTDFEKEFNIQIESRAPQGENGDRSWTHQEIRDAVQYAREQGHHNMADMITIAREQGMRLGEVVGISRQQAAEALRTGIYHISRRETKGTRERDIPLRPQTREIFTEKLVEKTGNRLFFEIEKEKTHIFELKCEQWLEKHRESFTSSEHRMYFDGRDTRTGTDVPLTWHGLRYSYAQERMETLQEAGYSWNEAASMVSEELGHSREEIIHTYLP